MYITVNFHIPLGVQTIWKMQCLNILLFKKVNLESATIKSSLDAKLKSN